MTSWIFQSGHDIAGDQTWTIHVFGVFIAYLYKSGSHEQMLPDLIKSVIPNCPTFQ